MLSTLFCALGFVVKSQLLLAELPHGICHYKRQLLMKTKKWKETWSFSRTNLHFCVSMWRCICQTDIKLWKQIFHGFKERLHLVYPVASELIKIAKKIPSNELGECQLHSKLLGGKGTFNSLTTCSFPLFHPSEEIFNAYRGISFLDCLLKLNNGYERWWNNWEWLLLAPHPEQSKHLSKRKA